MLGCRPQAEVNWPVTTHEKSLAPRVPPLRHILAKAPSTRIGTFLNPRLFESALQRGNFWRTLNPDAFSSGDATISSPVLYLEYCVFKMATSLWGSLKAERHANFARFTTHALLPIFPAESWVLEWSRIPVGYVWTGKSDLIRFDHGYVWTWKLLNPERKSCGFRNIRIHVDGAENS